MVFATKQVQSEALQMTSASDESRVSLNIVVDWDTPHQTLNVAVASQWTWDDLDNAIEESVMLAQTAPGPVAAIVDVRTQPVIPGGPRFISQNYDRVQQLLAWNQLRHNTPILLVGANDKLRIAFDSLRMIDPHIGTDVFFTDTAAEALLYLRQFFSQFA
jgi:hypothetical protein